ncbi:MAG: hypothetical protein K5695_07470 [Oscillospiraceae bacterium]|nr:hypothetical protein [Oscillospiraceae bacterium]
MKHTWKKATSGLLALALLTGGLPTGLVTGGDSEIVAQAYTGTVSKFITFELTFQGGAYSSEMLVGETEYVKVLSTKGDANGVDIGSDGAELHIGALNGATIDYVEMKCSYVGNTSSLNNVSVSSGNLVPPDGGLTPGRTLTINGVNGQSLNIGSTNGPQGYAALGDYAIQFDEITVHYLVDMDFPAFTSASLSLADDLALNFYTDDMITAENYKDYYATFEGATTDEKSEILYNEKLDKYYVSAHFYAKDFKGKITANLYRKDETDNTHTHTTWNAASYLQGESEKLLELYKNGTITEAQKKELALIYATMGFCQASDMYFGVTLDPANEEHVSYVTDCSNNAMVVLGRNNYWDVVKEAHQFLDEDTLMSLVLNSKTAVRLYVKGVQPGANGKAPFASTIESTKADFPSYYQVTGLLPQQLSSPLTIDAANGKTYQFTPLGWSFRASYKYLLHQNYPDTYPETVSETDYLMANALIAYSLAADNYVS